MTEIRYTTPKPKKHLRAMGQFTADSFSAGPYVFVKRKTPCGACG